MNILVDLDDDVIEKYELTSNECLFLSWFINFYGYGKGKVIVKDDKQYLWITYNKILDDIKTLRCTKRQVARMMARLCKTGLIEKCIAGKNKLYLWPNFDRINNIEFEGQKSLTLEDIAALDVLRVGQKSLPIINYNKNYIKILINNDKVKELDANEFWEQLKINIKDKINHTAFECIFYLSNVHYITDNMIIAKVGCSSLVEKYEEIFKQAIFEIINDICIKTA